MPRVGMAPQAPILPLKGGRGQQASTLPTPLLLDPGPLDPKRVEESTVLLSRAPKHCCDNNVMRTEHMLEKALRVL